MKNKTLLKNSARLAKRFVGICAVVAAFSLAPQIPAFADVSGKASGGDAPSSQPQIALPPPQALIVLIRSTLVALSQANMTNNYTVLYALGSKNFQARNTSASLGKIFTPFRTNQIDLNTVVFTTPQLTQAPAIENGRMRLVGVFPTQPIMVTFDLMFEPDQGSWKLFGLGVNLAAAPAITPAGPPAAAAYQGGGR